MLKKTLILIGIVLSLLIVYGIYKIATFELFDSNVYELEIIRLKDRDYVLKLLYIPSDATIQSSIQVRKIENRVEEVLENFEKYNYLDGYRITDNRELELILRDTLLNKNSYDTLFVKLP